MEQLNLFNLASFISGLLSLCLFLSVFLKAAQDPLSKSFLALCLFQSYLSFIEFLVRRASTYDDALFLIQFQAPWPLVVAIVLHFVLSLTGTQKNLSLKQELYIFVPPLFFTLLPLLVPAFRAEPVQEIWGWSRNTDALSPVETLTAIWAICCSLLAVYLCWKYYRKASEVKIKNQARLTLTGISIPVITAIVYEVSSALMDRRIPELVTLAVTAECLILGVAIWKYGLLVITPQSVAETILATISDGVFVVDAQNKIALVNKALVHCLGYEERELIGKPASQIFGKNKQPQEKGSHIRSTEADMDWLLQKKNGDTIPVSVSWSTMRRVDNSFLGSIFVTRDISERKRIDFELKEATNQLIQKEKMSVLGELAASINHEINQPINTIGLISQEMSKYSDDLTKEEVKQNVDQITDLVRRTKRIIDHMGYLSRRTENLTQELFNVNYIIEKAIDFSTPQMAEHHIEVIADLADGLPLIMGDQVRIEQVFLNLISNARYALTEKDDAQRQIHVTSRLEKSSSGEEDTIKISVADNGMGMLDEDMEKIFQPFYSTKKRGQGTGLGLAIVKRILTDHKAMIDVSHNPAGGTIFHISFQA